jgi:hypothetical protein
MSIKGNDLLAQIENAADVQTLAVKLGQYMRNYVNPSIQKTAKNAAVSTTSQVQAPAPPESVNVTTAGEMIQVQVNHTAPVQKGVHYIYHLATNPQFTNAQIEAKPATRAPLHFVAPSKNSSGTAHDFYVAVQVQYPGGPPSAPTYYGGSAPAKFNLSGTTQMDILPGTGSGTAANGGQALVGLGKSQVRLAQGAKRSV